MQHFEILTGKTIERKYFETLIERFKEAKKRWNVVADFDFKNDKLTSPKFFQPVTESMQGSLLHGRYAVALFLTGLAKEVYDKLKHGEEVELPHTYDKLTHVASGEMKGAKNKRGKYITTKVSRAGSSYLQLRIGAHKDYFSQYFMLFPELNHAEHFALASAHLAGTTASNDFPFAVGAVDVLEPEFRNLIGF